MSGCRRKDSRLATIYADRTRLYAQYRLGIQNGTLSAIGKFGANSAMLDQAMTASIAGPLDAAAETPIGPVAKAMVTAIRRTTRNFDIDGDIRMVNFPGGGARPNRRIDAERSQWRASADIGRQRSHLLLAQRRPAYRQQH